MKKNKNIFTYEIDLNEVKEKPDVVVLKTKEEQNEFIAERLGLKSIKDLSARIEISKSFGIYKIAGTVECDVLLEDALTLDEFWEPITAEFSEDFKRGAPKENNPEVEEIYYFEGETLDVVEVISEYIALEIPSYPRQGEEVFVHKEFDEAEEKHNPFADLKEKLGKKE